MKNFLALGTKRLMTLWWLAEATFPAHGTKHPEGMFPAHGTKHPDETFPALQEGVPPEHAAFDLWPSQFRRPIVRAIAGGGGRAAIEFRRSKTA